MVQMTDIYAAYVRWDAMNPDFYPLFERFTLEVAGLGWRNIGVRLIWERIRWESMIRTTGDPFKLNDHYHALYARRFMNDHPEFEGLFRTRIQSAITVAEQMSLRSVPIGSVNPRPRTRTGVQNAGTL